MLKKTANKKVLSGKASNFTTTHLPLPSFEMNFFQEQALNVSYKNTWHDWNFWNIQCKTNNKILHKTKQYITLNCNTSKTTQKTNETKHKLETKQRVSVQKSNTKLREGWVSKWNYLGNNKRKILQDTTCSTGYILNIFSYH